MSRLIHMNLPETINRELRTDKAAQEALRTDPVGYLRRKGIVVSKEDANALQKEFVKAAMLRKEVRGSNAGIATHQ